MDKDVFCSINFYIFTNIKIQIIIYKYKFKYYIIIINKLVYYIRLIFIKYKYYTEKKNKNVRLALIIK